MYLVIILIFINYSFRRSFPSFLKIQKDMNAKLAACRGAYAATGHVDTAPAVAS